MPTISLTLPNNGDDAVVDQYNAALQIIQSLLNGGLDDDNFADEAVILSKLSTAVQNALVPVGVISPFGGSTAPNSAWLLCYGQAVSRSTYAALFTAIGTAFGVGNGTTTFNLPDMRGRVPVGFDSIGGTAANRIQGLTTITTTNGSPTATVASASGLVVGQYITSTNVPAGTTVSSFSGTTVTMSANATATAAGTAVRFSHVANDAQVIGASGGSSSHVMLLAQAAAHAHSSNITDSTGGAGFNALVRGTSSGNQTIMDSSGGGQAHPNMQPSLIVNYIIKV